MLFSDDFVKRIHILLYSSGLSGEFLGWALSKSLADFSVGEQHWEEEKRCKYSDAIGRTLGGGDNPIQIEKIPERLDQFFTNSVVKDKHLVLSHPDPQNIVFIRENFINAPLLEITSRKQQSKQFQYLGRKKITTEDIKNSGAEFTTNKSIVAYKKVYTAPNHLEIEWCDLILNNTEQELKKIEKFVGSAVNIDLFLSLLDDYKQRNHQLIQSL